MPENKRFYWLKLQEDFFEDETIRYIEEQENGIKYSNFYLKLCLKSLRTDGKLIRLVGEMLIPYDVRSLSSLTGVDPDTVRCAMDLLQKIGCVKVLDSGELFISQLSELVGSETDKAKIMRAARAREKSIGNNVTAALPECYPEKEIDKEKEIEKENKRSASAPLDFDRFWKAYPLKKAKQAALKAWKKINPDKQLAETIIAAVEKQKRWEDWTRDNGQYIPHPATWLNQGRWEDEERSGGEQKQKEKCIDTKYVYEQLKAAQKYWSERGEQGLNEQ